MQGIEGRPLRVASRVAVTALMTAATWAAAMIGFHAVAEQSWRSLRGDPLGRPEDAVALAAAGAGLGLAAWWGAAALLTGLAATVPASWLGAAGLRRCAQAVTPSLLRRAVCAGLGVALLGVGAPLAAAPATAQVVAAAPEPLQTRTSEQASAADTGMAHAPRRADAAAFDPGWWPTSRSTFPWFSTGLPGERARTQAPAPVPAHGLRTVVVRPGDTLWGLVARDLGGSAPPARIAAEWPRWYAANRAVIGPDPDRLRPGQRLRVPGSPR